MRAINPEITRDLALYGFHYETTGGGCGAFVARYPDGSEVWITADESAHAPAAWSDAVLVGVYASAEAAMDGAGAFYRFRSLTRALVMLAAREDRALTPAAPAAATTDDEALYHAEVARINRALTFLTTTE
jgi:hypothetical protein